MRFPTAILTLFLTLVLVNASNGHDHGLAARHSRLYSRMPVLEKKAAPKRCTRKKKSPAVKEGSPSNNDAPPKKSSDTDRPTGNYHSDDVISASSSKCGPPNAVAKTTKLSGPNGSIDFLNCGINNGGWSPPSIKMEDLVVQPLSQAIKSPHSPFKACSPYEGLFEKYGSKYNIPAIFLASFAMQESSCNPNTIGGGGEQGLMQITREKCGSRSDTECRNPDYNIATGAKYFANNLASNDGNVLIALGQYNGWTRGMTYGKATAARHSSCCRCQNNLDYLHQFLNGWLQNINAYDNGLRLGKYFNLDVC